MKLRDAWPFLLAVAARAGYALITQFTADDAYITFRYAENLATGPGFVYNPGEHVLGTSTPGFTLLLAALRTAGIPVWWGAAGILFASSGIVALLLARFARGLGFGRYAWLPPVLYAFWPRSLAADTSGMETAFFAALVVGGFYAHHRRREGIALSLAAGSVLVRPEGLLLLGVLGVHHLTRAWRAGRPGAGLRAFLVPAGLLGAWGIYAWRTFGSPVPNSIPAKLALYERFFRNSPAENVVWILAWHNPVGWILCAAAAVGAWWLFRRRCSGMAETAWLLGMVLFFALSRTHLFFWYPVPIYPVYLLLGAAALPALAERLPFLNARAAAPVAALLVLPVLLLGAREQSRHYRSEQAWMEAVHKEIGLHLARRAAPDDLVAAEDIGYMGWFSRRRILDRDGLVSPSAVPYNRRGDYLGLVLDAAPGWVVVSRGSPTGGFVEAPAFRDRYVLDRAFAHEPGAAYDVYRRAAP